MQLPATISRREGVPLPRDVLPDADHRLYRSLEAVHGERAHARYLALLRQLTSFADSCRLARVQEISHAR